MIKEIKLIAGKEYHHNPTGKTCILLDISELNANKQWVKIRVDGGEYWELLERLSEVGEDV